MSNLQPNVISLDKGLNLQTAKLVAPPGSVLDTLNYEQVDFQGQKRIDGFVRYDGSMTPAIDSFHTMLVSSLFDGVPGDLLYSSAGLLGVLLNTGSIYDATYSFYHISVTNTNALPVAGELVYVLRDGVKGDGFAVQSVGPWSGSDPDSDYALLLQYSEVLRRRVGGLPGQVIGLHWFKDRLYAVADVTTVSLNGTTPVIYPNDMLTLAGSTVKVLDSYVKANTRVVFVAAMDPLPWQVEGTDITRNGTSVGAVANGFESLVPADEIASFFESRTDQQVLTEDGPFGPFDFGWRFVDQGWVVLFSNGLSLFGGLPSLNQNITQVGVQGPTTVSGANGKPLTLVQKMVVQGKPAQVRGWKSTTTPSSYELNAADIADGDSHYTYADAFISWTTAGAVSAPGMTTATLTEYPADNSVIVDLTP